MRCRVYKGVVNGGPGGTKGMCLKVMLASKVIADVKGVCDMGAEVVVVEGLLWWGAGVLMLSDD